MARRRNRSVDAAYIPVASNAGDLAAMAQANAAFGDAISGMGGAIKTGATDWAGHETDRAVQYLDTLADDQARNAALAQMQQDPIGAFLDVGAATKAVDAMQLRDFKVDERAEQALKSDDAHKEAVRALTQQKIMDPEELRSKIATTDKTLGDIDYRKQETEYYPKIKDSAVSLEEAQANHEAGLTSKLDIDTKIAKRKHGVEQKKIDDTEKVGGQLTGFREKYTEENDPGGVNQLKAINEQIKIN